MFVYTLKANTLKFFSIIGIALIALVSLILFVPRYDMVTTGAIQKETENIHYDKIRDNADWIWKNIRERTLPGIRTRSPTTREQKERSSPI